MAAVQTGKGKVQTTNACLDSQSLTISVWCTSKCSKAGHNSFADVLDNFTQLLYAHLYKCISDNANLSC